MDVHVSTFDDFVRQEWNFPGIGGGAAKTQLRLCVPNADITGGRIRRQDIDALAAYPDVRSVTVSGLDQDTFEYFIATYGRQLRFIEFFKNKAVEDWSLLGTLPELEGVEWFHNQRITKLWDMRENRALKAVVLRDFTRLHDLSGIENAPALAWFDFGDAVWRTSEADSLTPLAGTKLRRLDFSGRQVRDRDLSFVPALKTLEVFNFPTNLFTTEQVAWLTANCPALEGFALAPYIDCLRWNDETRRADIPAVIIVGKRKPMLTVAGNEARIANYLAKFKKLAAGYTGAPYPLE